MVSDKVVLEEFLFFQQLYCPIGISSGCFPPGKTSCDRVALPNLRCNWLFQCFHNPSNSGMDHRIFNVCTDGNACGCTRGCRNTIRESARNLTLVKNLKKSFAAPGNRTCPSGVPVRRFTSWATSPPQNELRAIYRHYQYLFIYLFIFKNCIVPLGFLPWEIYRGIQLLWYMKRKVF